MNQFVQQPHVRRERRAFSIIEILFALIILGIGFIMIAALLPVAARQTEQSSDQATAAAVADMFFELIKSAGAEEKQDMLPTYNGNIFGGIGTTSALFAVNPPVLSFARDTGVWQRYGANSIYEPDPRFAWVGLYQRQPTQAPSAVLHVLVAKAPAREFTAVDLFGPAKEDTNYGRTSNLTPRVIRFRLVEGGSQPDLLLVRRSPTNVATVGGVRGWEAVAPGAFVVIAYDGSPSYLPGEDVTTGRGRLHGRSVRVGQRRPDKDVAEGTNIFDAWELLPGFDMPVGAGVGGPGPDRKMFTDDDDWSLPSPLDSATKPDAWGYILGRPFRNPIRADDGFEGDAMDIAYFSTTISLF